MKASLNTNKEEKIIYRFSTVSYEKAILSFLIGVVVFLIIWNLTQSTLAFFSLLPFGAVSWYFMFVEKNPILYTRILLHFIMLTARIMRPLLEMMKFQK